MTRNISRRNVIVGLGASALAARKIGSDARAATGGTMDGPFPFGVASGDPWPDGFVLWTRLVPTEVDAAAEPLAVGWQVATDPSMKKIVRQGRAKAHPDWDYSVHVELTGLMPDSSKTVAATITHENCEIGLISLCLFVLSIPEQPYYELTHVPDSDS